MLGLARLVTGAGGGQGPSLNFNFVDGSAFSPQITFTRASSATYFNSSGVLTSAGNDEPRFDYDPATLAARGFLIEEQRVNSLTYSEQFDNAAWDKLNLNTTGTPSWVDVEVAPDGTTTADKIIEDTATGSHAIRGSVTPVDNTTYTFSVFAKAAERNLIQLLFVAKNGGFRSRIFDLSNGTSTQSTEAGYTTVPPVFGIQAVGNGWYRCWVGGDSLTGAVVTNNARIHLMTGTSSTSYTGDGTSGAYVWGAQLEAGAFPTSYIPTTAIQVTRSADVASVNTLSPWYNAAEGTLFAEWIAQAFTHRPATFNDGTQNNAIALVGTATNIGSNVFVSNVFQGTATVSGTFTTGTTYKQATAYKLNDTQDFANGVAATTDTTISIPTVTQLLLGAGRNGMASTPGNGWLRRFTYYPRRLSQAEGAAITA